jgi:hypothetical protein
MMERDPNPKHEIPACLSQALDRAGTGLAWILNFLASPIHLVSAMPGYVALKVKGCHII